MAQATPTLPTPWPKLNDRTDDFIAQINAMLDERDYTSIPEGYYGWNEWFAAAAEGAWR